MWRHRWRSRCKYENASVNKWWWSINSCVASWKKDGSTSNDERISFETMETLYTLNDLIKRVDETERSPANLLGANWSRRYRSRNMTVSQTIVARCCNRWSTHWAPFWLIFSVLHVHCTLSYLCVLLQKYRTWTTKVNSPVYSASGLTV